jgi:hypothetical protein
LVYKLEDLSISRVDRNSIPQERFVLLLSASTNNRSTKSFK